MRDLLKTHNLEQAESTDLFESQFHFYRARYLTAMGKFVNLVPFDNVSINSIEPELQVTTYMNSEIEKLLSLPRNRTEGCITLPKSRTPLAKILLFSRNIHEKIPKIILC